MVQAFVYSEAGGKLKNEDAVSVQQYPADGRVWICALADGQGGQFGGERAAQLAVEVSLKTATTSQLKQLSESQFWEHVAETTDKSVSDNEDAGYTTLVICCINIDSVLGVSSGDSAAIILNKDGAIALTENQIKNPPVGSGAARFVSFHAKLKTDWKLLVVSDGVWKYIGWELLTKVASENQGDELISSLRELAAKSNGGRLADDFSIALFESNDA